MNFQTFWFITLVTLFIGHREIASRQVTNNDFMFDYGKGFDDTELPKRDDGHLTFDLGTPFRFFDGSYHNKITVDTNGAIWMGSYCKKCLYANRFPKQVDKKLVACFWTDFDPEANPASKVYARVVAVDDAITWASGRNILRKAHGNKLQFDVTSNSKVMIVATWSKVTHYGGNASSTESTFQCAIMTDGKFTYALFDFVALDPAVEGQRPLVGVDTAQPSSSFTLLNANTSNVAKLVSSTNFLTRTRGGGPSGWWSHSSVKYNIDPVIFPATETKTCQVNGDPHYYTFDGLPIDSAFGGRPAGSIYKYVTITQPPGHYVLVGTQNCKPLDYPPITVLVNVEKMCPTDSSIQPLTVAAGLTIHFFFESGSLDSKITEIQIELKHSHWSVTTAYDGVQTGTGAYTCPSLLCSTVYNKYTFEIKPYSQGFKLATNFGFTTTFQYTRYSCGGYGTVAATLPYIQMLRNNVFGYCGNMDGISNNDNFCSDSQSQTFDKYQTCWQARYLTNGGIRKTARDGVYQCQNYPSVPRTRRSATANHHANISLEARKCNILKDNNGPFAQCQTVPSLDSIYSNCIQDLNAMNGDDQMFCNYAKELAKACSHLPSVTSLKWRTPTFCPSECPQHSRYSSEVSPCPPRADDPLASEFCEDPPTDGCICDKGYIMQNDQCVQITEHTGCLDDIGNSVRIGHTWLTQDCLRNCTCNSKGLVTCTANTACHTHAHCGIIGTISACKCNHGFYGNGYSCSWANNCAPSNNCQNGATCVTTDEGYKCYCKTGYTGRYCDTMVDHCSLNHCNNGTCLNSLKGYSCACFAGYAGHHCEYRSNWCASFPCTNLATCLNKADGYVCKCQSGFVGRHCETFEGAGTSNSDCANLPDGNYCQPNVSCSQKFRICVNGSGRNSTCPDDHYFFCDERRCVNREMVLECL